MKQLLEAMKDRGMMIQQQRGYAKKELKDFAQNNQIGFYDRTKDGIAPGLEGTPKGL